MGKISLRTMQKLHNQWSLKNFGICSSGQMLIGVMEEVGELAHSHLKYEQNIRGTSTKHIADAKDAVGDIVMYLIDYCNKRGFDFEKIIQDTWKEISKRDWEKNPETGEG